MPYPFPIVRSGAFPYSGQSSHIQARFSVIRHAFPYSGQPPHVQARFPVSSAFLRPEPQSRISGPFAHVNEWAAA